MGSYICKHKALTYTGNPVDASLTFTCEDCHNSWKEPCPHEDVSFSRAPCDNPDFRELRTVNVLVSCKDCRTFWREKEQYSIYYDKVYCIEQLDERICKHKNYHVAGEHVYHDYRVGANTLKAAINHKMDEKPHLVAVGYCDECREKFLVCAEYRIKEVIHTKPCHLEMVNSQTTQWTPLQKTEDEKTYYLMVVN